jgi:glycogen operon protein
MHMAGIEVLLDVVFNHTAEGGEQGPLLSLRGLDDAAYYARDGEGRIFDSTGCGNTIAAWQPAALRLIMDSLRYWVKEMHVDGFRFDLATTLGRGPNGFDAQGTFFAALAQDPVLAGVKLIAEPWDVGQMDSYQVGYFPKPWRELNGKYRDALRRFWRSDVGMVPEFAKRLCGSEDLYGRAHRGPLASVNFLTSHDGFTLADLVTYESKYNLANAENNQDGDDNNHSASYAGDGLIDEAEVRVMRERVRRSFMASLLCSVGVPFLTMGDERGRSQMGNNNAYCQDNDLSWMDWSATPEKARFTAFVAKLVALRQSRSELRRVNFFDGKVDPATRIQDVLWLTETGEVMQRDEWHDRHRYTFGAVIEGNLCVLFNNGYEACEMTLPKGMWALVFDTGAKTEGENALTIQGGGDGAALYRVESRAMVLLSK